MPKIIIYEDKINAYKALEKHMPMDITVKDMQRYMILRALKYFDGNRTKAAHILGITVRGMRNWIENMKKEGFEVPEGKPGRK